MPEPVDWKEYCFKPENALGGNCVRAFHNGDEAFAGMKELILSAKKYILLEFYIFSDDSVGRMFRELLAEKAAAGVAVHLIYDSVGSILTDRDFFSGMAACGIRLGEFRPVALWKPYWSWAKRDHRKLICVDGEAALVGGFNITANDAPVSLGGRGWKDSQALVRGPVVAEVERLFWESWAVSEFYSAPGESGGDCSRSPAVPEPGVKTGRGARGSGFAALLRTSLHLLLRRRFPAGAPALRSGESAGCGEAAGGVYAAVLSASGMRNSRSIRRSYSYAIDRARRYIYITNAYFLPDRFVYRRLIRAVRRGVDVRIIGPYKTDHPYVRWATWSIYPHMIKNGIKLYEWRGNILHSKTAVIDGIWSSVGSHNLDHRSLHYNMELNLNIYDREFGAEMARVFNEDLANSRPVSLEDTRNRPFPAKAAGKILYLFRSLM